MRKKLFLPLLMICVLTGFLLSSANAQTDLSGIIGDPPGSTKLPVRFGFVNLDSGNLHLEIPLYSTPERGVSPVTYSLIYDSTLWYLASEGTDTVIVSHRLPLGPSLSYSHGGSIGYSSSTTQPCYSPYMGDGQVTYTNWTFTEENGTQHSFYINPQIYSYNCLNSNNQPPPSPPQETSSGAAYDSQHTGMYLSIAPFVYSATNSIDNPAARATIYWPDGSTASETSNGNQYFNSNETTGQYTDQLGASLFPTPSNCGFNPAAPAASNYYDYPYTPQTSITCAESVPAWDGSAGQASNAVYTYTWEVIPVCTQFWGPPLQAYTDTLDFCGGMWALKSLLLPDGVSQYSFGYDESQVTSTTSQGVTTYTLSPGHYGRLTSLTLPTGGTIAYGYAPQLCNENEGSLCLGGGQTQSITDSGGTTTISYTNNINAEGNSTLVGFSYGSSGPLLYPETVTYPAHNTSMSGSGTQGTPVQDQSIYSVSTPDNINYTMTVQAYSGSTTSGTLLKTTVFPAWTPAPASVKTTWNVTGITHEIDYQYDTASASQITQKKELLNGSLLRTLNIQYLGDTSTTKYNSQYHMINYPQLVQLSDGSSNLTAQTQYNYDQYSAKYCPTMLASVKGASGHDDSRDTGYLARGNVTTTSRLISNGGLSVTTHACYDTLGNVLQSIDGRGHPTIYSYADNYFEHTCIPSTSSTYAFPTLVTDPLGHQTKTTYYSCLRVPEAVQDPNDVAQGRTGTTSTYDIEGRPLCVNYPDGGQSCKAYPTLNIVQATQLLLTGKSPHSVTTTLDGFGRATAVVDTSSGTETDTSYDAFGRVSTVSNPYGTASDPTYGVTGYIYDSQGRVTVQSNPDHTMQLSCYDGLASAASPNNCSSNKSSQESNSWMDYSDEAGRHWQRTTDPVGRLTSALEPNASNIPALETDYIYDTLNNLLKVNQNGVSGDTARVRQFNYDFLSRLVSASNPETGQVCYEYLTGGVCSNTSDGYDANGNLTSKTDARGVTTTYSYDALNRLLAKTYTSAPAGTLSSCYQYDSATNGVGRLAAKWTQSGACSSTPPSNYQSLRSYGAYDAMGRVLTERQCAAGYCTSASMPSQPAANCAALATATGLQYCYDLEGDLLAYSNGLTTQAAGQFPQQALLFSQTFDAAGRLNGVSSSWSDATHPQALFSTPVYTPFNDLSSWLLGTQLTTSRTYDNRLRVTGQSSAQ